MQKKRSRINYFGKFFLNKEVLPVPKKLNILFICTGNTCRSVMAQGLFTKIWDELNIERDLTVSSAGVGTLEGLKATPEALKVLEEEGIDLSAHRSQIVDQHKVASAHYIFTMTRSQKHYLLQNFPGIEEKVWVLEEFVRKNNFQDIPDPYGFPLDYYRAIAAEIKRILGEACQKLSTINGDEGFQQHND
jgi:protein-tyrosine-phosphatase